jgi:hypothetical protein
MKTNSMFQIKVLVKPVRTEGCLIVAPLRSKKSSARVAHSNVNISCLHLFYLATSFFEHTSHALNVPFQQSCSLVIDLLC